MPGIDLHYRAVTAFAPSTATRVDDASATVTYIGTANPGTATSAAAWQICRVTTSATTTTIEWADGNSQFDNVWDNRASLAYS